MKIFYAVFSSMLLLSSCATILNGNDQKVTVFTNDTKSKVFIDGVEQGSGKAVVTNFKRDLNVHQVKITTNGFKDHYYVNYQTKKSPYNFISYVPFAILILPPILDKGPKIYNYENELYSSEKPIPILEKSDNEKYVFFKNSKLSINSKNLQIIKKSYDSSIKDKLNKENKIDSLTKKLQFSNDDLTNNINKIITKYAYTDSTNTINKNKSNTAYISANLTKINFESNYKDFCGTNMTSLKVETEITWNLLDIYDQPLYSKKLTNKSGDFSFDYNNDKVFLMAIEDAITNSFLEFMVEKKTKTSLRKTKLGLEPKQKMIELYKSTFVNNIEDAINSTVIIKTKNGTASGIKIGKDGYIITNFNIVANSEDKIIIITRDNREYEGKLIRKSESLDLALINVDATFEKHFEIVKDQNLTTGETVLFIGGSKTNDQEQLVSQNTITGRKEDLGFKNLLTDATLSNNYNGGPMVTKDGKLVGITNTKFINNTEKNGLAIPAEFITTNLYIK